MTTITAGRWLLVALVIVGLALAATAVSAHGTDTTTDLPHNGTDASPYSGSAAEWDGWMESHATGHGGHGTGVHFHGAHTDDARRDDTHRDDAHGGGVQGNGHGMGSRGHGC